MLVNEMNELYSKLQHEWFRDLVHSTCAGIDKEDSFYEYAKETWGEVDLCGAITVDAISALESVNEEVYELALENYISNKLGSSEWVKVDTEYYETDEVLVLLGNDYEVDEHYRALEFDIRGGLDV